MSAPGAKDVRGRLGQFGPGDAYHESDALYAYYTMPPTKQQAFTVTRKFRYAPPGIDRVKLIAALRQKYGPETKSIKAGGEGDININAMYWLYDEQGHFVASDNGASHLGSGPFNCEPMGSWADSNIWVNTALQYRLNRLVHSACDTFVELSVMIGGGDNPSVTGGTTTEIDDRPLLFRDVKIAGDAAKAEADKQQQQKLQQSKQAKPNI